jgi:dTDP-glucose 4,6-dehydratase
VNVLVTGGAGFVGSSLVHLIMAERPAWRVVNLDQLTYAGNPDNLAGLAGHPRHRFVRGDVRDAALLGRLLAEGAVEAVLHLASESHVDRSIAAPAAFVDTNVRGTQVLLDACRAAGVRRFVQVSTDEVYGSLGPSGLFTEESPLAPSSPYSATKAAADLLALAYGRTYGLPVVVTRSSNNYGPRQFPEKLIPLLVTSALRDLQLPVYGDGQHVRDWVHVEDHCRGLVLALERGRAGQVYNLGASCERRNLELVRAVLAHLGKPESLIRFVADRPGHDRRYAIDAARARSELGWEPRRSFDEGLAATVDWYRGNRGWWERILSGEYRAGLDGGA